MKIGKIVKTIDPESISEEEIAFFYLDIKKLPCLINSPIRKDNHPSFGLKVIKDKVIYKDFSTGESGDIYQLLCILFDLNFSSLMRKIQEDFNNEENIRFITKKRVSSDKGVKFNVKIRKWKKHDIDYWGQYGLEPDFLEKCFVFPIEKIFFEQIDGTFDIVPAEKYAYVYVENKDNKTTLKIYQPYSKKYKWLSNHNSSVIDLWFLLPEKGDLLIITSSRKDAMTILRHSEIPSISLQGEHTELKESVANELKMRFKHIIVLYDNDFLSVSNVGRTSGKKMAQKHGFRQVEIPTIFRCKDPSDLYANYGKDTFVNLINQICTY